jgi:Uma2 family endonuclease
MITLQLETPTDSWISATWDEYLNLIENPLYEQAKAYYYNGSMRLEMLPVGSDHAKDHAIVLLAISLYGILQGIPFEAKDSCSYRRAGLGECQPDVSYYVVDRAQVIPQGTGIINLDRYPAPDLVIEVAVTSLLDDQGAKRLLYEELGIAEYWIVDVEKAVIFAFAIADRGSKRIDISQVFSDLAIATLESALRLSRQTDQSQVGAWLMTQFQTR